MQQPAATRRHGRCGLQNTKQPAGLAGTRDGCRQLHMLVHCIRRETTANCESWYAKAADNLLSVSNDASWELRPYRRRPRGLRHGSSTTYKYEYTLTTGLWQPTAICWHGREQLPSLRSDHKQQCRDNRPPVRCHRSLAHSSRPRIVGNRSQIAQAVSPIVEPAGGSLPVTQSNNPRDLRPVRRRSRTPQSV